MGKAKKRENDYVEERDLELRRLYRMLVMSPENASKTATELWGMAVKCQASRLYMSPETARRRLNEKRRGVTVVASPSRRRLVEDLWASYDKMLRSGQVSTIGEFVGRVIDMPAREFYIAPDSARMSVGRTCRRLGLRV